jgi:hypothetical protein
MISRVLGALALCAATPAIAGPPYITDDPVPTNKGGWEIYSFIAGEGGQSDFDADAGLDINYGAMTDLQLTATVPLSFSHEASEPWRGGSGDLEVAVKYRVLNDSKSGLSASVFPRAILPTSGIDSDEHTRFLLPIWVEKDFPGGISLFGGGGYEFNPGAGKMNFWQAGVALTQNLSEKVSVGAEVVHQSRDALDEAAETNAGVGSIIKLSDHYSLLFSGGPTRSAHRTTYHFYGALGLFF